MKRRFRIVAFAVLTIAAGSLISGCGVQQTSTTVPLPVSTTAQDADAEPANNQAVESSSRAAASLVNVEPNPYFETPVRIQAGGEFVAVEAPGYACPTMADVDGDGKQDLVVGQFNQGNMQFCKNIAGENQPPKFAAAEWLKSSGGRATVPGVW